MNEHGASAFALAMLLAAGLPILTACVGRPARRAGDDSFQCLKGDAEQCAEDCHDGDSESCNRLGEMYEEGDGIDRDPAEAGRAYARACEAKRWAACSNLGRMYASGEGVPQSEARAIELYMNACAHGDLSGCSNLRADLPYGERGPLDRSNYIAALRTKCDRSDVESCVKLGVMYDEGAGVPENDDRAQKLFLRACKSGSSEGCYEFASRGPWSHPASRTVVSLYDMACGGGHLPACLRLARMYSLGNGVVMNMERALDLRARAHLDFEDKCNSGELSWCIELGRDVLYSGRLATDEKRALALFQYACDGGAFAGCTQLARYYRRGWDVAERDPPRAAAILEAACDRGYPPACADLADVVYQGEGAPKDTSRAAALYKKACRGGDLNGCARHGRSESSF